RHSLFFLHRSCAHRVLPSFPTRRSSDLAGSSCTVPTGKGRTPARSPAPRRRKGYRSSPWTRRSTGTRRHWWWPRWTNSPNCPGRSEEHTSELQSRENLVCRLLLEKKKKQ